MWDKLTAMYRPKSQPAGGGQQQVLAPAAADRKGGEGNEAVGSIPKWLISPQPTRHKILRILIKMVRFQAKFLLPLRVISSRHHQRRSRSRKQRELMFQLTWLSPDLVSLRRNLYRVRRDICNCLRAVAVEDLAVGWSF